MQVATAECGSLCVEVSSFLFLFFFIFGEYVSIHCLNYIFQYPETWTKKKTSNLIQFNCLSKTHIYEKLCIIFFLFFPFFTSSLPHVTFITAQYEYKPIESFLKRFRGFGALTRARSFFFIYDTRHNGKPLDLFLTFRLSGLPNHTQVELIQASRSPSVVSVALQLPPSADASESHGSRLTGKFASSASIWQILRQFESGAASSTPSLATTLHTDGASDDDDVVVVVLIVSTSYFITFL